MYYIQMKQGKFIETVDQFETNKEAKEMLREYKLSDSYSNYYISSRACKDWN